MKKILSLVLAVAAVAGSASAYTQAEIDAMVAQFIASLGGTATTTTVSATTKTYTYSRLLKVGKRGNDVKELQMCLNRLGNNTGIADGIFGRNTKAGVMSFQAENGLVVDGIIGPQTGPKFETACAITTETEETTTTPEEGVTGDKLVVSGVAADDMLVGKEQKVVFTKVKLEAGDEDVKVNKIYVEKTGSSDRSVISKVTLLDDAMLEIDSDSLNSDDEARLRADIIVKAHETKVVYIGAIMDDNVAPANITANDGLDVSLKITSITTTGADVDGIPVIGAVHTVKDNVTVDQFDASISKDENSPKIGETVKVATVTVDNSTNDDQTVKSLKLKRQGTARDDSLEDVEIKVSGQTFAASQDDDEYIFDFGDGIKINDGDDIDMKVYATIADDDGTNFAFDIMDITVLDTVGVILSDTDGAYVSNAGTADWTYSPSVATIGSSNLVLRKTSDISDGKVAANSDKIDLASFDVDVDGQWVEGDVKVKVTLDTSSVTPAVSNWSDVDLNNVALYTKDGSKVSDDFEDATWSADGQVTLTFTDVKFEDAGNNAVDYVIKGDISRDAPTKTKYTLDDIQIVSAETRNGDTVGPFPAAPKNLNITKEVEGATIAVKAKSPSPAEVTKDNSVGDNGSEQLVAELELDATDSGDDIHFTEVKFDIAGTEALANVTNCTVEGSTDSEDAGTSMTFSLDETVTKDTKKTLLVKCDISSAATAANTVTVANVKFDAEGVNTTTNFNNTAGTSTASVAIKAPVLTGKLHADNQDAFAVMENTSDVTIATVELEADKGDVKVATMDVKLSETDVTDNLKVRIYVDGDYKGDVTLVADNTDATSEALNFVITDGAKAKVEFRITTPSTAPTNNVGALTLSKVTLSDTTTISPALAGNNVTVVNAMPAITKLGNNVITTTTSLEADKKVMEFKVNATGDTVTITKVDVDATIANGMKLVNAELKVYSDSAYTNEVSATTIADITATGSTTVTLSSVATISEGDTYYFVVEGDVQAAAGSSMIIEVKDDATGIIFTAPAGITSDLLLGDDLKTTVNTTL